MWPGRHDIFDLTVSGSSPRESQIRCLSLRIQLFSTVLVSAGATWFPLGVVTFARGNQEAATVVAIGVVAIAIGIMARRVGRKAHAPATLAGASQR